MREGWKDERKRGGRDRKRKRERRDDRKNRRKRRKRIIEGRREKVERKDVK